MEAEVSSSELPQVSGAPSTRAERPSLVDLEEERRRRFAEEQDRRRQRYLAPERAWERHAPVPGRDIRFTVTPTRQEWAGGWTVRSPMGNERIALPPQIREGWHNLGPYGGHGRWGGERGTLWVGVELPPTRLQSARAWLVNDLRELARFLTRTAIGVATLSLWTLILALVCLALIVAGWSFVPRLLDLLP